MKVILRCPEETRGCSSWEKGTEMSSAGWEVRRGWINTPVAVRGLSLRSALLWGQLG